MVVSAREVEEVRVHCRAPEMDEMTPSIAICSLTCRYPDAGSVEEFWINLIDGRRSFRRIPPERLDIAMYSPEEVGSADSITPVHAGLLTNWHFNRGAFLIPRRAFETTDLTHWLALQLAAEAIEAVGGVDRLDRSRTAVIVANTLTGEFSRAALLRLRQPFLDELLQQALDANGTATDEAASIRDEFARRLVARFAEPNEDSLAGGLANTIAGRIANHFDLKGGAYSVDGACSSSLLAVANAASLLQSGTVDAVVTGAVDLSLDPFELVGFSRNGALSSTRMRVFDVRSDGFWPGEGGAFSILMRADMARKRGFPIEAILRGWGMSTDGAGGLTRPDSEGQMLAYRRAHEMAHSDPRDLAYVEAHGTGTPIGDLTEITALAALREGAATRLPIGSVKANIGHTKAAAGFAGLIKAVVSLRRGGIPPHAGCEKPHPAFRETDDRLYPLQKAQAYNEERPQLTAVSSFGFGGINLHVVLEGFDRKRRSAMVFTAPEIRGEQGAELFLFRAVDRVVLRDQLASLRVIAPRLSVAALADAAATGAFRLGEGELRLAFVARDASELCRRIDEAIERLSKVEVEVDLSPSPHLHFGSHAIPQGIGFLFSGQAAPVRKPSPVWLARFPFLRELANSLPVAVEEGMVDTAVAQPAIVYANLATLGVMEAFGIEAVAATGHSLGELAALAWARSLDRVQALDLAAKRGALMARCGVDGGAMLRLGHSADDCRQLAVGLDCDVACVNGLAETVMSGSYAAISALSERARQVGADHQMLPVSHAFHSPDMAPVIEPFRATLAAVRFKAPSKPMISTTTGRIVSSASDIPELLCSQLIQPVQFVKALSEMAQHAALLIELGPGSTLTRLAKNYGLRSMAVDSQSDDLSPLLSVLAATFAAGHDLDYAQLFDKRGTRPFDASEPIALLSNPCGRRSDPTKDVQAAQKVQTLKTAEEAGLRAERSAHSEEKSSAMLEVILTVIGDETGLPVSAIHADARFQADLHLNSLTVAQIVFAICRRLGRHAVRSPTDFANATPAFLASQLAELASLPTAKMARINGIRRWAAPYGMAWHPCSFPKSPRRYIRWSADLSALDNADNGEVGLLIALPNELAVNESTELVAMLQQAAQHHINSLGVIHDRLPISAFFRSLHQEGAFKTIILIDRNGCEECDRVDSLLSRAQEGFSEYRLVADGGAESPVFERLAREVEADDSAPAAADVILAVGCHRGIGAECAFSLAAAGSRIVFAGRSHAQDPTVTETLNLARMRGLEASYELCDVTNPSAVKELARHLGEFDLAPTILLFAPAVNEPMPLASLTPKIIKETISPKVEGLATILDEFGGGLQQVIAFGSIIGRIGLEGESHYALANALQSRMVEDFARRRPSCRCLSLEWTVWSGAGMGERLGTIERLEAKGVDALPFDEALLIFQEHVTNGSSGTIAITGRFGPPPGLNIGPSAKHALRFIDQVLVNFPGTELVAETEINLGRDPYLADHLLQGRAVFPGVMGLEAMAQAVTTLADGTFSWRMSDIAFHRIVFVPQDGLRIRIAALRADTQRVDAAVFTEEDDFQSPSLTARFEPAACAVTVSNSVLFDSDTANEGNGAADDLYGPLFFQGRRFRRVQSLDFCTSRIVQVGLSPGAASDWFGSFEPAELVLGDPGTLDAALHALQATLPHRQVLPVSIGDLVLTGRTTDACHLIGKENWADSPIYSFDITALDAQGNTVASWLDVRVRALGEVDVKTCLEVLPELCQPYLERTAREELGDDTIRFGIVRDAGIGKDDRRKQVISALKLENEVVRRSDGRPILAPGNGFISLSHADATSVAVYGASPIACDIAEVDASYADATGMNITAVDWTTAEVQRKLGQPAPFSSKSASRMVLGALSPVRDIFTRTVPSLGLVVTVGRLCADAATESRKPFPSKRGVGE